MLDPAPLFAMEDLKDRLSQLTETCRPSGRPFVTVSYAQSIDGSIATRNRRPLPLSGPDAMRMTHALRALHDGILVGIETVLADDPQLSVRLVEGPHPQPVVLDSRLRTPGDARLLQGRQRRSWLVGAADNSPARVGDIDQAGAEVLSCPRDARSGRLDLPQTLALLHTRGIKRLMVEGGARVITSFIQAQLVDLFIVTIAPQLVGGLQVLAAPTNGDNGPMQLTDVRYARLGDDLILWARPVWPIP
ncbi:MAG: RibD family protein [Desulfobacterales bacterium]|jgi:3,4-dihydroxy 2-butanone 4-phosphate synthase/GTP cyclohydrolase II